MPESLLKYRVVVANACPANLRNLQAQYAIEVSQRQQAEPLAEEMHALAASVPFSSRLGTL
jgi:hypothetical protein